MIQKRRVSGLQNDVITLYRILLRKAKSKDIINDNKYTNINSLYRFVIKSFKENAYSIEKNDFMKIEHMLR